MDKIVGQPYRYNDYVGHVVRLVENGSFKNSYEVYVKNEKTGEAHFWWFKKEIMEKRYNM